MTTKKPKNSFLHPNPFIKKAASNIKMCNFDTNTFVLNLIKIVKFIKFINLVNVIK